MDCINSVYLKGKIIKVYPDDNYIRLEVKSGRQKNKFIPVIIYYTNNKPKLKCLSELKVGSFISIRGHIASYSSSLKNNVDCIISVSYKVISYTAYSNSFVGIITGVNNLHKIENGVCCNIHIKTDRSLTIPAIAFGPIVGKLKILNYLKNKKIASGNISLNKYNRICLHLTNLNTP